MLCYKTVVLNETELSLCYMLAGARHNSNVKQGFKNQLVARGDPLQHEVIGVAGEFAFAKVMNVFPRLLDEPKRGGYDCLYKYHRVDVKSTTVNSNKLWVYSGNNQDVDIYVLCYVQLPIVEIRGWAWHAEVINLKNRKHDGSYEFSELSNKPIPFFNTHEKLEAMK